jgi:hypothetical protein
MSVFSASVGVDCTGELEFINNFYDEVRSWLNLGNTNFLLVQNLDLSISFANDTTITQL